MKLKKLLAAATAVLMLSAVVFTANADSENASAADEPPSQSVTETTQNELGEEEADEPSQEESDNTYADNAGNDDDTGDSETGDVIDNSEIGEEGSQDDTAVISDNDGIALMSGDIVAEINEANFPDENFRNYIKNTFDTNEPYNVLTSDELSNSIYITDNSITDLTGIEYFKDYLTSFSYGGGSLVDIDLSGFTNLTVFNYSGCTALKRLDLSDTGINSFNPMIPQSLESLDLSGTNLNAELRLQVNALFSLTSLKVNNCPNLLYITVNTTGDPAHIKSIEARNCDALSRISFYGNELVNLDLTGSPMIDENSFVKEYNTYSNQCSIGLDELNGDKLMAELEKYGFDAARASNWQGASYENGTLQPSGTIIKYDYDCGNGNTFTATINIELYFELTTEYFTDSTFIGFLQDFLTAAGYNDSKDVNKITNISFNTSNGTENIVITGKASNGNTTTITKELTSPVVIDGLKYLTGLTDIICSSGNSYITSIDAGSCVSIEHIELEKMKNLVYLDAGNCPRLLSLKCNDAALTTLNVSGSVNLEQYLYCQNNHITKLDLTGLTKLKYIDCRGNDFESLDASGFTALIDFRASYCPNLREVDLSGCSALTYVEVIGNSANVNKDANGNIISASVLGKLESIDLSGCTALKELYLEFNQLTEIDLSDCTLLEKLNLQYNKFSSLDLGNLTSLKIVDLQGNDLTSVTVAPGVTSLGLSEDPVVFLGCVTGEDNLIYKIHAYDPNFKFEKAAIFEGANVSYNKETGKLTINDYGQNSGDLSFKYTYDTGVSSTGNAISALTATFKFTIAGELTVSNTVAGNAANLNDSFTFTVDLGDESINETYSYMYSENGEYKYVETEFTNGIATFILKNGESRTVELPAGYKYTVTESGYGDYVVSCNGNVGDSDSGNIIKFDTALAAFTNEKNQNKEQGTPDTTVTAPSNPDNSNNSNYYGEGEDMSSAAGIYEEGEQLEIASYAGTAATIIIVPVIIIPAIILKKRYKTGR